jgi:hypothetical protein
VGKDKVGNDFRWVDPKKVIEAIRGILCFKNVHYQIARGVCNLVAWLTKL